jgi:Spy/CpxP family protein refolding chaperone
VNTWKVILATLVIFGAGIGTGSLLIRHDQPVLVPHRQHLADGKAWQPGSAGGMRLEFLRRVQRDLDLNPEQRERIDKILKESQDRTRVIMEPVSGNLRDELKRTRDEFREALTPEQRMRFDELLKRQQHPKDQRRQPGTVERGAEPARLTNAP